MMDIEKIKNWLDWLDGKDAECDQPELEWRNMRALLAEVERLQDAYESKAPGTQGAMLDAFYALLPEGTETSSRPAPVMLREHIERLQAIEAAAREVCDVAYGAGSVGMDDFCFVGTDALEALHDSLAGEDAQKPAEGAE